MRPCPQAKRLFWLSITPPLTLLNHHLNHRFFEVMAAGVFWAYLLSRSGCTLRGRISMHLPTEQVYYNKTS